MRSNISNWKQFATAEQIQIQTQIQACFWNVGSNCCCCWFSWYYYCCLSQEIEPHRTITVITFRLYFQKTKQITKHFLFWHDQYFISLSLVFVVFRSNQFAKNIYSNSFKKHLPLFIQFKIDAVAVAFNEFSFNYIIYWLLNQKYVCRS